MDRWDALQSDGKSDGKKGRAEFPAEIYRQVYSLVEGKFRAKEPASMRLIERSTG
jgi:hypothetical protein